MGHRRQSVVLVILSCLVADVFASVQKHEEEPYFKPEKIATHRPIIGMLTLPVTVKHQLHYGPQSFATSYVRWMEAGGARVAPIFYDSSEEELHNILSSINGVVWTGGLVDFNPTHDDPEGAKYLQTTKYILDYVLRENSHGNYYPLWGTCLGFERLVQLLSKDKDASLITKVDAENLDINLSFTGRGWLSRLFGGMNYELFKAVASPLSHLAYNNHGLGIRPEDFVVSPAHEVAEILSIDMDRQGVQFVSTIEGRKWPIYGTQWHPEKAPWEWSNQLAISHIDKAIEFSNYIGRFFVDECKYNRNKFPSQEAEEASLVYNYPSIPTGNSTGIKSAYTQIYFFPDHKERSNHTHTPTTEAPAQGVSIRRLGVR